MLTTHTAYIYKISCKGSSISFCHFSSTVTLITMKMTDLYEEKLIEHGSIHLTAAHTISEQGWFMFQLTHCLSLGIVFQPSD